MRQVPALLGLVLAACGGSGTPTCAEELKDFESCGGAVSGTWRAVSMCTNAAPVLQVLAKQEAGCEDTKTSAEDLRLEGTLGFAESTYESDLTVSGGGTVRLSDACLQSLAAPDVQDPADLCAQLEEPASCAHADGTCTCAAHAAEDLAGAGAYHAEGGTLSLEGAGVPLRYCVRGDRLVLKNVPDLAPTTSIVAVLTRIR